MEQGYAREIHQQWVLLESPVPEWASFWVEFNEDWVKAYDAVLGEKYGYAIEVPNIRERWESGYYKVKK